MPHLTNRHVRREVNAANRQLDGEAGSPAQPFDVLCECGRGGCLERLQVPVAVFDEAVASEGWFVVAVGHEPRDDRPVRRGDGYSVIGPTPVEPAPLAELRPGFAIID